MSKNLLITCAIGSGISVLTFTTLAVHKYRKKKTHIQPSREELLGFLDLYSIEDAARYYHVPVSTVQKWLQKMN